MRKRTFIIIAIILLSLTSVIAEQSNESSRRSVRADVRTVDDFDFLLLKAWDLYTKKQYDEALVICAKAAAMRPDDNRPYAISGAIYMGQWKMKSASDAFAKAISLSPRNKVLHLHKAKADRYRNAREESIAASRKAIELDPGYAEAYEILGDALAIGATNNKESIEALRTAIKLKPDLLTAYRQLAMQLSAGGNKKEAEEVYRKAIAADPKKMAGRFDLGRLLVDGGRLDDARALWEGRTSDTDNTFPNFITVLERAEKLKHATDTLAKKPDDPEALVQMGLMVMDGESWVVDGRQERAIEYFRKALAIKPNFAEAQYAICKAYVEIADMDKSKNKKLDEELARLRRMDAKLANEIVAYRKSYKGGITGTSRSIDQ